VQYIRRFETLTLDDIPLVGGKNASFGEMIRELGAAGVRVPGGFAVTAEGYRALLDQPGVRDALRSVLEKLDADDLESLQSVGSQARRIVRDAPLPEALEREIREAYAELSGESGEDATDVAVRSSATAEDLPEASFAGQQETYLNVRGVSEVLDACHRCFASLFTDRAISYRTKRGFDHEQVLVSVGVQKMVRSDLAGSGVMFTLDTETGFGGVVLITSSWGLGETIVQGIVNPDEHLVFKPTGAEISRRLGSKEVALVYAGGGKGTRTREVSAARRSQFVLSREEAEQLAQYAIAIERHYGGRAGQPRPMDIEWAKDGRSGELFVVQARPETAHSVRRGLALETYTLEERGRALARGRAVGTQIGSGSVMVLESASQLRDFTEGSVLVTTMTDPDWEPVLRRAAAVVTDRGGRTCHAAIVSRELGIPCVVGAGDATHVLEDGQEVTVSCAEGDEGVVFEGKLPFRKESLDVEQVPSTRTKIYLNLADPDQAFRLSFLPVDGVGLVREEFIITHWIGAHPMALAHPERLEEADRRAIEERTRGFASPSEFFVSRLAEGIARIAAGFHPRPVIVRLSDFKTNEYAGLVGGATFEFDEENPMLGFRGASRYAHDRYRDGFALECEALRRVREDMGLDNVVVMIPFCRTVDEAHQVQEEMARNGLARGRNGLRVYVMCEIPANVLLVDEFAQHFDGFSIGSNDLTQLVLGVDRDSEVLSGTFDERDPAVARALRMAVEGAHEAGVPIGICGQAPSDHPQVAEMLVRLGIDSLSLSPDVAVKTKLAVAEIEKDLGVS